MIAGTTRVCGLIGKPVEHTLSPLIHNTLADILGHDLIYVPFEVESGSVSDAVLGAYALNVLGLNVTVPHKIEVVPALADTDSRAAAIGAVNTLVRTDGGYVGYNTDYIGLERALRADDIDIRGRDIVILGAGGAARSAAFLCAFLDAERVYILNRSKDKAELLAAEVNKYKGSELCKPLSLMAYSELPGNDLIAIQASSVGLFPHSDDVIISDKNFYDRVVYGFDLIYRPADTRFMEMVRSSGGRASNGLKMLLYQGIAAYELWNDCEVSENAADRVYTALNEAVYNK